MNCAAARETLWPPERLRVAEGEVLEARRHIRLCHECRGYMRWDTALVHLHARLRVGAPPCLHERLFEATATCGSTGLGAPRLNRPAPRAMPASGRAYGLRGSLAVAVSIVAAIGVAVASLVRWSGSADPVDSPSMYIEDYIRRAVSEDRITTSDPRQVARFLTRELGRPARPLDAPALAIVSAEICILDGVRGAMIQYERAGRVISHYLIPRRAPTGREAAPRRARSDGIGVVVWVANAFEHALIGELPADSLAALVEVGGT